MFVFKNTRKKTKSHCLSVKLKALKQLENGVPAMAIADELNVAYQTVRSWQKNKSKLSVCENDEDTVLKKKKRMRKVTNELVEKALWIWFKQRCAAGIAVQGTDLRAQAKLFHAAFGGEQSFGASKGWLYKWQIRHEIQSTPIYSEESSVNSTTAEIFKLKFMEYVERETLSLDQIFHCEETVLGYKIMPETALFTKSNDGDANVDIDIDVDTDTKVKFCKKKITIMVCSNASGTFKLPLMIIGKYAKPRAIKNYTKLPVYYKSQSSSWINRQLFEEWFNNEFVPKVNDFLRENELPAKAVLFVDDCASHSRLTADGIITKALPPKTMSFILPVEQNCLYNLKVNYRRQLISRILNSIDCGETFADCLNGITIKDVIFWLAMAWEQVSMTMIRKSWNRLLPNVDDINPVDNINNTAINEADDHQLNEFYRVLQREKLYAHIDISSIKNWLNPSTLMQPEECLSDCEIVNIFQDEDTCDNSDKAE